MIDHWRGLVDISITRGLIWRADRCRIAIPADNKTTRAVSERVVLFRCTPKDRTLHVKAITSAPNVSTPSESLVLALLRADGDWHELPPVGDLAQDSELNPGTVRQALHRLIASGAIEARPPPHARSGSGRFQYRAPP